MSPADEDYAERLAIVLEGGDVAEARARELAAVARGCAQRHADAADGRGHGDDGRTPHEGAGGRQ